MLVLKERRVRVLGIRKGVWGARGLPSGDQDTKATFSGFGNSVGAQSHKEHLALDCKYGQHKAYVVLTL